MLGWSSHFFFPIHRRSFPLPRWMNQWMENNIHPSKECWEHVQQQQQQAQQAPLERKPKWLYVWAQWVRERRRHYAITLFVHYYTHEFMFIIIFIAHEALVARVARAASLRSAELTCAACLLPFEAAAAFKPLHNRCVNYARGWMLNTVGYSVMDAYFE